MRSAAQHSKIPTGKQLSFDSPRDGGSNCAVRMLDAPGWMMAAPDPVPVVASLRKAHRALLDLRGKESPLSLDRRVRQRGLLLLQSLAIEAERRVYAVRVPRLIRESYGWVHRETKDHLQITVDGCTVGLRLTQTRDSRKHEPTVAELEQLTRNPEIRLPMRDHYLGERLRIELFGGLPHRQSSWSDSRRLRLDDALPLVLQEIELRGSAAEAARLARLESEERRRIAWELAMVRAKDEFRENQLERALLAQAEAWRRYQLLADYLDELELQIKGLDDPHEEQLARDWLDWGRTRLGSMDPVPGRLGVPPTPDPTRDQLQPFLKGVNPYRRGCSRMCLRGRRGGRATTVWTVSDGAVSEGARGPRSVFGTSEGEILFLRTKSGSTIERMFPTPSRYPPQTRNHDLRSLDHG